MGEKDIAEKQLESHNDVFADIVNVFLFDGEQIVKPEDLQDAEGLSAYKFENRLHEQERDVAKYWVKQNIKICMVGLENQTGTDPDMPVRVLGYDAAAYSGQILRKRPSGSRTVSECPVPLAVPENRRKQKRHNFPVITIVLYFGMEHWGNTHLREWTDWENVPEALKKRIPDYFINVFEIARLDEETVSKFRSDFRIVADYFRQMRENKNYVPKNEQVQHVDSLLKMLKAVSGDRAFEKYCERLTVTERQSGGINMRDWSEDIRNEGRREGIREGRAEGFSLGEKRGKTETARNLLMMNLSCAQIAQATGLSLAEVEALK